MPFLNKILHEFSEMTERHVHVCVHMCELSSNTRQKTLQDQRQVASAFCLKAQRVRLGRHGSTGQSRGGHQQAEEELGEWMPSMCVQGELC